MFVSSVSEVQLCAFPVWNLSALVGHVVPLHADSNPVQVSSILLKMHASEKSIAPFTDDQI